jgi:hypothetical protein
MAGAQLDQQQQTIRIPLYAHDGQRQSSTNLDYSDSRMMPDQLLVNCYPMISRDPLQGDKPVVKIQSRMGWIQPEADVSLAGVITNLTSAYAKAVLVMTQLSDSVVIAYVDGSAFRFVEYRISANTAFDLGTIAFGGNFTADDYVHLSELTILGIPYLGIVVSNKGAGGASVGYYCASTGGVLDPNNIAQITDVDYPPNATYLRKAVGPLVQLNNVVYQMTEGGFIHGSTPSAAAGFPAQITVWDTAGVTPVASYPDRGCGLIRYKHHLVAFGEETVEFYNDEGRAQPGLPIARTDQAFLKMGTIGQKSFINVDDVLWFVGKSGTGHMTLYRMEGYTPMGVAQPTQVRLLSDRPYVCDLQITTMHGVRHLITNLRAQAGINWFDDGVNIGDTVDDNYELRGNLCYCVDSNAWWLWVPEHSYTGIDNIESLYFGTQWQNNTVTRICMSNVRQGGVFTYSLHPRLAFPYFETSIGSNNYDGYRLNNDATIDTYRIPMMICTNSYDFGNNSRKFIRSAKIIGDYIRNYDDGFAPYPAFNAEGLTLNFGVMKSDDTAGQGLLDITRGTPLLTSPGYRYFYNNLGQSRQWKFVIAINTYVPIRLEALELIVAQGTH